MPSTKSVTVVHPDGTRVTRTFHDTIITSVAEKTNQLITTSRTADQQAEDYAAARLAAGCTIEGAN
ncbi:hypothetical protein [Corynebacterium aurimucosum]|uniref:hypothetical protein n=1 Tax=Corynebacterium aurimucosum TaxID=169292 RepID=UPI00187904DE|nr:hypothetical protein [Corynebacterium aurimucosum]MBE7338107.1 hypothetical protein [Corynebacterium aurimucosum]